MFFFEDGLDTSSCANLLVCLWIEAVGDDSFYACRGIGGDLGGRNFILFFVSPVCPGPKNVNMVLSKGPVRCLCLRHDGQDNEIFRV
jgi:hypothetical protein